MVTQTNDSVGHFGSSAAGSPKFSHPTSPWLIGPIRKFQGGSDDISMFGLLDMQMNYCITILSGSTNNCMMKLVSGRLKHL